MVFYDQAAWGVIVGLSLMVIGGLVLWAYGAHSRSSSSEAPVLYGPESEATRIFHTKLVSWFLMYGCVAVAIGMTTLIWAWIAFRVK